MTVFRKERQVQTRSENDLVDLSDWVRQGIRESGLNQGIACVHVPHSTAAVVLMENEAGLRKDLPRALERNFPKDIPYEHNSVWGDGNGHAHVRSTILSPSVCFPFDIGVPSLGTWQQVVLVELDRGRDRQVLLQLVGE